MFYRACAGHQACLRKPLYDTCVQVLHILGEQFDEGMDILGVACNVRKQQDRIEVWTKTASDEAVQYSIGQQLKTLLKLPAAQTIGYTSHEQAKLNSSQNRKASKMDTYTA